MCSSTVKFISVYPAALRSILSAAFTPQILYVTVSVFHKYAIPRGLILFKYKQRNYTELNHREHFIKCFVDRGKYAIYYEIAYSIDLVSYAIVKFRDRTLEVIIL